jgi:acetyl-CoA carboxylase carboxyl transferase subunit beta
MSWFNREKPGVKDTTRRAVPDGLWQKCPECSEIIYKKELEKNLEVCPNCGYHERITPEEYIALLLDEGSWVNHDQNLKSLDPLNFPDYKKKYEGAVKKTGMLEGFNFGDGKINGTDIVFGSCDFRFMGGSMGSVVGELVSRSIRYAAEVKHPLIIIGQGGGGARMHEGILSLMQMVKTSAELALLKQAKVPFIEILTNPTMAGVMASWASLGDVILAEPGALLGFTGPRVIEQTIGQKLPPGFQSSEFQLEHGFVDAVVERKNLRESLIKILKFFVNPS